MRTFCFIAFMALVLPVYGHAQEKVTAVYTNTDYINNLFIDGDTIWCGTWEGGLAGYNRKTGTWKVFTSLDGLANNTVQSIFKDTGGALWIAHADWGLSCFDGKNGKSFPELNGYMVYVWGTCEDTRHQIWCSTNNGVYIFLNNTWVKSQDGGTGSIAAGKNGSVWCYQDRTLLYYDRSEWRVFTDKDTGFPLSYTSNLLFDKNDVLWFQLWGGDPACFDGKTWQRPPLPKGSGSMFSPSFIGPDGNIWIVWHGNICRFNDAKNWEIVIPGNTLREAFSAAGLVPGDIIVQIDDEGIFWIADNRGNTNHNPGLFRFDGKKIDVIRRNSMAFLRPASISEDRSGALWTAGLYGKGISRLDGTEWKTFTNIPVVPYYEFTGTAVDNHGNVWCSAHFGALRYDGAEWRLFDHTNSGLRYDGISSLYLDSRGVLWFIGFMSGAENVITSFDGSSWKTYDRTSTGCYLSRVKCVCEDRTGAIIAGGDSLLVRYDGAEWKAFSPAPEGWVLNASFIAKAPDGNLWCVGYLYKINEWYKGGSYLFCYNGTEWKRFPVLSVGALAVDKQNIVWIGSSDSKGVSRFDGSTWTQYGQEKGLATRAVDTIYVDRNNTKWIGTQDGMFCIGGAQPTGIKRDAEKLSGPFFLSYRPNPFNSSIMITFILPSGGKIELAIFSVNGQKIKVLKEDMSAGIHSFLWDGRDDSGKAVSSGVYLSRLQMGEKVAVGRMLLLK